MATVATLLFDKKIVSVFSVDLSQGCNGLKTEIETLRADVFTMCVPQSPGGTPVKLPTFGKKGKLTSKKQAAIDLAVEEAVAVLKSEMQAQMATLRQEVL